MPIRDVTVAIKDGGSSGKKKKEDENKTTSSTTTPKVKQNLPPLKTQTQSGTISSTPTATTPHAYDTPTLSPTVSAMTADGVSGYSGSNSTLNRTQSSSAGNSAANTTPTPTYGTTTNPYGNSTPNYGTTTTPTTSVRQYTYDDYLDTLSRRIALEALQQWERETYTPPIHKIQTASTANNATTRDSTQSGNRRLTVEDMNAMSSVDRQKNMDDFLRGVAEEKREREAEQQRAADEEKRAKDQEIIRSKLYEAFLKNPTDQDVAGYSPETINYFYNRALQDVAEGKISSHILNYITNNSRTNLDKTQSLVYNGNDNAYNELMKNAYNNAGIDNGFSNFLTARDVYLWKHFEGREEKNGTHPTFDEVTSEGSEWVLLPKSQSVYHDNGIGKSELKYIHPDGREAVFDGDTLEPITDPNYIATYNYAPIKQLNSFPSREEFDSFLASYRDHFSKDMIPYYLTYNSNTREEYEKKLKEKYGQ